MSLCKEKKIMKSLCGANCDECKMKDECKGCESTCGRPFGGRCVAAEYIKTGGRAAYDEFKNKLLREINELLKCEGLPQADALYELLGAVVNLEYPIPSGGTVKLLDDKNVYLGTQIEFADMGVCYGVVADMGFILVCSYSVDGSQPEIVVYKRR